MHAFFNSNYFRFIISGFLFAMVMEFSYKIFARFTPELLPVTALWYLLMLQFLYCIRNLTKKFNRLPHLQVFFNAIIGGIITLIVFEWGLVGNSPWGNPNASQLAMLAMHCGWVGAGSLFMETNELARKYQVRFFYGGVITLLGSALSFFMTFPLSFIWVIYFVAFCYFILDIQLFLYGRDLGRVEQTKANQTPETPNL